MYNRIIAMYLSQCLYSVRDYIAFGIGMSSIGFWIICQLPQLVSNCKSKSVAALSVWFLLQWFAGDAMNLVGCYLTNQLITQKATALLYICMDCIVIVQYLYYSKCKKKSPASENGESEDNENALQSVVAGSSIESEGGDMDATIPTTTSTTSSTKLLAVMIPMAFVLPFFMLNSALDDSMPVAMAPSSGHVLGSQHGHALASAAGTGRQLQWFTGFQASLGSAHSPPPACVNTSGIPQVAQV